MEICPSLQSGQRRRDTREGDRLPHVGTQAVCFSHALGKKKTFRKLNVGLFFPHVLNITIKMKADLVVWKPLSNLLEPKRKL